MWRNLGPGTYDGAVPELPEVEAYRRLAAEAAGRTVAAVEVHDRRFLRHRTSMATVTSLSGLVLTAARRRGKLLVLDLGPTLPAGRRLGLHFGMAGRLLLDGRGPIDRLLYTSGRDDPAWDRLSVSFDDGSRLVVSDPRLLGGAVIDPDEEVLGPDAASCTLGDVIRAMGAGRAPLKARLLDQGALAGIGNLVADELLWRAGLAPTRPAGSLDGDELRRLHRFVRSTLRMLMARGGSHTGDLMPQRRPGGRCPRDGTALRREPVGGRTTWWCPAHQR